MNLLTKSLGIFLAILLLLLITALFSTPAAIGLAVAASSLLVIWQTIIILKDES